MVPCGALQAPGAGQLHGEGALRLCRPPKNRTERPALSFYPCSRCSPLSIQRGLDRPPTLERELVDTTSSHGSHAQQGQGHVVLCPALQAEPPQLVQDQR